ncbi:MAG: 16S rRNA (guanine(966)-N(2))-methyltransferase RsmD [Flavobacteriia bacterium]|nr:16S rRNA (guanine(966)-N(2))-methyltransferase RsmD [Flavobacteriia bacterium]
MRIIRGILKGKRFTAPKSFPSRPTTDFAKEGLFNMLESRIEINNLHILDLCAGTGNITFEFCSREAKHVVSVDQNASCASYIFKNVEQFQIQDKVKVIKSEVRSFLKKWDYTYDLIFFDPPYESTFYEECISLIFTKKLLKENGLLIVEHNNKKDFSSFPNWIECRSFGNVYFSFFKS